MRGVKKTKKRLYIISLCLVVCMVSLMSSISFAVECSPPYLQITTAYRSGAAIDGFDTIHIAFVKSLEGSANLYYSKLKKDGLVVLDDVMVSSVSDSLSFEGPQIAAGGRGDTHIIWADNRNGNWEIYYSYFGPSGNVITGEKRITYSPSTSWRPSLSLDPSGLVNIMWIDTRDGHSEIYYKKIDPGGADVTSELRLTNTDSSKDFLSSSIDNNGNISLLWIDNRDGNKEVYFLKVNAEGKLLVSDKRLTSLGGYSAGPSIITDPLGNHHVTWMSKNSGRWNVYYAKFDAKGLRLTQDLIVSEGLYNGGEPYITNSKTENRLIIVFAGDIFAGPDIYYTTLDYNGNIIKRYTQVSDGHAPGWSPHAVVDIKGIPHFLWVDGNMTAYRLFDKSVAKVTGYDPVDEKEYVIYMLNRIKNRLNIRGKRHIEKAIFYLRKGLKGNRWIDFCHLSKSGGISVFRMTKKAMREIGMAIRTVHDAVLKGDVSILLERLYEADFAITSRAIYDARNNGADMRIIERAERVILRSRRHVNDERYLKAINLLASAWRLIALPRHYR